MGVRTGCRYTGTVQYRTASHSHSHSRNPPGPSGRGPPQPSRTQDFRKECIQRSERRDRRIHSVFRRIHSVIFGKTVLFHCVLWVFAEYTRIFAEYTRFLGVLRRIHSNAKGVYSAAEYTRISPDTLESRRIHSNLAEYTRFRRIHSLAEYTRIQKI